MLLSNIFLIFTPIPGEMIQFDLRIFFKWMVQPSTSTFLFWFGYFHFGPSYNTVTYPLSLGFRKLLRLLHNRRRAACCFCGMLGEKSWDVFTLRDHLTYLAGKWPLDGVDVFPIKNADIPASYVIVYQRVNTPQKFDELIPKIAMF